jgi:hypothetical protein
MRYQWISLGQDWITFFAGTGLLFLAGAALSVEGKGKETQMSPPYSTLDNAPPTDSFSSGSTPLSDARDFFNRLCDYPYKASVLIPIALLPIISLGMSAPPIMHHTHHQLMRQSPIHLWSHMWSHGSAPHWMSNIIPLVSIYGKSDSDPILHTCIVKEEGRRAKTMAEHPLLGSLWCRLLDLRVSPSWTGARPKW